MANEKETRRGGEADLWDRFCDGLKEAGAVILRDQTPNSELVRAEGYRYLTRLLQLGLDTVLENADRERPDFFRISSPTKKQGACNPDQFYDQAPVDGAGTYRIRGSGGSCPMIEISVYSGVIGLDPTSRLVGFLNEEGLSVANDGSFEVVLSPNEHPGNWIKLEPDARIVMIRQYRLDWDRHRPAEVSIDRLDSVAPPEPLTLARVDEALRLINEMVRNKAAFFARDSDQRGPSSVNTMAGRGAEIGGGMTMPGGVSFRSAYFKLERDQALLLDFTPPAAPYWGFQLTNYCFETMEYRYRPVSVNNYQAVPEPDGSMRVVVAGRDPGVPNWLDTSGHTEGVVLFRWARTQAPPPDIESTVVSIETLAKKV